MTMSPEVARLAAQIAAAPDDLELQRIFGDALIHQGGEHAIRGELLHLQLANESGERTMELSDSLRRAREARGLDGLGIGDALAQQWTCSIDQLAVSAAVVFAEEPLLRWLSIGIPGSGQAQVRTLATISELARVCRLKITCNPHPGARPGPDGIATLLASPHWPQLEVLALHGFGLGDAGAKLLAEAPSLCELHELDVSTNAIGPDGIIALVGSPILARLRHLTLWGNKPGRTGFAALAATVQLTRLELLDLRRTGATLDQVDPIKARFPRLQIQYEPADESAMGDGAAQDAAADEDSFLRGPFV
jgi:hypothetical protein